MRSKALRTTFAVIASSAMAVALAPTDAGAVKNASGPPGQSAHQDAGDRSLNYDIRTDTSKSAIARAATAAAKAPAAQRTAVAVLEKSLGVQAVVSIDPLTGTPRQIARLDGYLTAVSKRAAATIALDYVRAHADVFGLDPAAVQALTLRRDYVDVLGTHHLSWQMMVGGVPVFGNGLTANVAKDGRIISFTGSPLARVPKVSLSPTLTPDAARTRAATDVRGKTVAANVKVGKDARRMTTWSNNDTASLVVFASPTGARLGWLTYVQAGGQLNYQHVVDATSGAVLYRADLSSHGNGDSLIYDNYPGAPIGGQQRPVSFVGKGWLSPTATKLFGANAWAYADINDDNVGQSAEQVPVSKGTATKWPLSPFSSSSLCSAATLCSWDPAQTASWRKNLNEDVTQAFYFVNNFHDHLAQVPIGFTSAAGNFELAAGDPVIVNALDGAGTARGMPDANHIDNANMSTPPDGTPPLMQMYLFHQPGLSDADEPFVPSSGANESDIVYHEYTHGLSNRLVVDAGGNSGLTQPQSGAMGEAWSDWYAFDYLVNQGSQPDTAADGQVLVGTYVSAGQHLIRTQPLDCSVGSMAAACQGSPAAGRGGYTYGDYGKIIGGPEVHADGEIWGETLWDLRKAIGSSAAESVVTRAMELSPVGPSFLDMRNSIVQADVVAYGGSHLGAIWSVFAQRGMGWYAGSLGGGDNHPAEDFSPPPPAGTSTGGITGVVTDALTGTPIADAAVVVAGHDSGFAGDYVATTDASGRYTIDAVIPGTYPKVALVSDGYETQVTTVTVTAGAPTTADFTTRRDWASGLAGASVSSFNGPDYTGFGCGPINAIDQKQGSGWGSTTGDDAGNPTNVMTPKFIVVKLPHAVNISTFAADPSNSCGDPGSSSTGNYRIETSTDGVTYTTAAAGTFTAANRGKLNVLTPTAGATSVNYVKLWLLSPQVPDFATNCPAGAFGGCTFTDFSELEVFGTPAP